MLIEEVILAVVHILLCEHFTVNVLILLLLFFSVLKTPVMKNFDLFFRERVGKYTEAIY